LKVRATIGLDFRCYSTVQMHCKRVNGD